MLRAHQPRRDPRRNRQEHDQVGGVHLDPCIEGEWVRERKRNEQVDGDRGEDENRAAGGDEAAHAQGDHRHESQRDSLGSRGCEHHAHA